jgi:2-keto-4-pentenoate hydratase/2-oxohepta-3-ene-1,7-dioic acid hydratase in catechol pathway
MRLARFNVEGTTRVGAVVGEEVVDLSGAFPDRPATVEHVLAGGAQALETARVAIDEGEHFALRAVQLLSPIARPGKFLAIGLNYADHVAESPFDTPEFPIFFNKQATCVNGPYGEIERPSVSESLDYEGELGFVIGRRCRHVPASRAREVIAGYVVINDVSVRDWQLRTPTMTMGKSFDTHGPVGPWLVTADEVDDPHDLAIRTYVNGDLRQESNTSQLIFDCFAQVEHLTTAFTLEPGDIVATGTPAGVGAVGDRWLVPGDVVRIEIDGIGAIENRVVEERDTDCRIEDAVPVAEPAR